MASKVTSDPELDAFLKENRLLDHREAILKEGVEELQDLQDILDHDVLTRIGMTEIERKRFTRKVNEKLQLESPNSPTLEARHGDLPFSPVPVCSKTTKRIISQQSIRTNLNITYQLMTQLKPQVKHLSDPINGETMHYFDLVNIICQQERTILGNNLTIELYTCEGYPLATNPSCYISKLSDWCLETYDPILLYAVPRPKAFTVADQTHSTGVKRLAGNGVICIQNDLLGFGPLSLCGSYKEVTVKKLKEYIYCMTSLPPSCFTLEFNDNELENEENTLEAYDVKSKDPIVITPIEQFWKISWDQNFNVDRCLATWSETQTRYGVSMFFSSLYVVSERILKDKGTTHKRVLGCIRNITGYAPLIHTLNMLFKKDPLTLPHRVAVQELLMLVFKSIGPKKLKGQNSTITIQEDQILEESNTFWTYFIEYSKETHCKTENFTKFDLCCSQTNTRMVEPHRVMDSENIPYIVDKQKFPNEDETIFEPLPEYFRMIKSFPGFEAWVWEVEQLIVNPIDLTRDWMAIQYRLAGIPFLCIQPPLAIKEKNTCPVPCMMLREDGMICNYIGNEGKEEGKPYQGFDPFDGKLFSFDADDLDEKVRRGNVTQFAKVQQSATTVTPPTIDFTTITRPLNELEEIIMVVLDTSASMDHVHSASKTKYELAMTGFIQFCNRTTAYNFKNMIGLVIFGGDSKLELELTESFTHFSKEIKTFPSKGKTAIYDAVIFTIDYLNSFRIKQGSPINLPARIICLTDGGDNASRKNPTEAANSLIRNNIVMDSVLLSNHKVGTHAIAKLSGGYSFQPSDQKDLLRIFENETMLNFNCRKHKNYLNKTFQEALTIHFDTEPEFLHPGKLTSTFQTSEKCLADAVLHKIVTSQVSPEVTKRILRELAYLQTDPHPSFEVFPCSDAVDLWHLMLEETAQTPYEGGVFRLYIEFTKEYPNKPPNIRFITPIYHCNINSAGRICHMILDRFYSPEKKIRELLDHIYGLLLEATPDDPLDSYKATLLRTNKQEYDRQAKAFTQLHAINKTKRQVRIDILGDEDVRNSYPAEFVCPLTLNLFKEPVTTRYGETYEKEAIESYLRDVAEQDPFSFQPLQLCQLVPNNLVKRGIEQFRARLSAL
eukprot:TRINITY_DN182_c0_g1_i5.p1 TRINITY_DN182_c0_g1~~TRINITY_DN182_c0_g1_i5.p1  ORF type:complete len:1118 (-),score=165.33 TRINITY_DN182_c0_g1_i5:220-3573(-)